MASIEKLQTADQNSLGDINALIHELSPRLPECSIELLQKIVDAEHLELWVLRDGEKIIGMGTLAIVRIPEGERGQIEDVVVLESHRGQGLGEKISRKLIERARERKIPNVTLSSRAERVAANNLYQKLGFTEWPTNVYKLKL